MPLKDFDVSDGLAVRDNAGVRHTLLFAQQTTIGPVYFMRTEDGTVRIATIEELMEAYQLANQPAPPAPETPAAAADPAATPAEPAPTPAAQTPPNLTPGAVQ